MSRKDEEFFTKISYFKILFSKKFKESKALQLIRNKRKIRPFNPFLTCIVEDFDTDYRNPLTLEQLCYKFLHLYIIECMFENSYNVKFISTINVPSIYENLQLPETCIQELLKLYVHCRRHCLLFDLVPNNLKVNRYILKSDSILFCELQKQTDWDKRNNFRIHNITELFHKVLACKNLNFMTENNTHYHAAIQRLKQHCHELTTHRFS